MRPPSDQAADILAMTPPGDLIPRGLGYCALLVLAAIETKGDFFLSRFKQGGEGL